VLKLCTNYCIITTWYHRFSKTWDKDTIVMDVSPWLIL